LLFEDYEDAETASREVDGQKSGYTSGPVKTWLKIGKNRYGTLGAFLALKHIQSETRFEAMEGGKGMRRL
jgi:hypothetical protein